MEQFVVDMVEKILNKKADSLRNYSDSEYSALIEDCIREFEKKHPLTENERKETLETVFNGRRRLGIIQPLLDDPNVNEIMINGTESIYIERNGKMEKFGERYSDAHALFNVVQSMVSWVDRSVNESSPIVDTRLSDGSRVNIVLKPVAINGPIVTIRKFKDRILTGDELVKAGSITGKELDFLKGCVKARVNIFVSGGTSSGKTTFLNVLCSFIPHDERIVTVEDSAELRLSPPNLVRLETRNANSEGVGIISMRALIKTSLRMRPDRIIVGEVRDEAAVDMLQALCTGHDGSMSTAHANTARDVLTRIETMALWEGNNTEGAVKRQISSGIDLIVHMEKTSKMERKVREIAMVSGFEKGEILITTLFKDGEKINAVKEGTRLYEKIRKNSEQGDK